MQGDEVMRELLYAEDKTQSVELHFEKHEMYNRRIVAKCRNGHELYQDLICGNSTYPTVSLINASADRTLSAPQT